MKADIVYVDFNKAFDKVLHVDWFRMWDHMRSRVSWSIWYKIDLVEVSEVACRELFIRFEACEEWRATGIGADLHEDAGSMFVTFQMTPKLCGLVDSVV